MGNTLMTYLNKRVHQANHPGYPDKTPGPVITISREVGCSGLELAHALKERLALTRHQDSWKVLSKEIFQISAHELDLEPEKVAQIFKHVDRNAFDDILYSFREKSSISEKKVRNTVIDVIRTLAEDGHCIIVGRAGHIITSEIKNSLHIRLVAPPEFRVKSIMVKNKLSHEDAIRFISQEEKDRLSYRNALKEKQTEHGELFDITFNRAEFDIENIVDFILYIMEKRGMLKETTNRIGYF
jgi:cytidylate kinase